jgi:hypothetical protein
MIDVIGGIYHEVCLFPFWDEYYGSGLRAAKVISGLVQQESDIRLSSYCSDKTKDRVSKRLKNISLNQIRKTNIIKFSYLNSLMGPEISGIDSKKNEKPLRKIQSKNALVFGLLEGNSQTKVDAKERIVYDPQSPDVKQDKPALKSDIGEMAIVLNRKELFAISGISDFDKSIEELKAIYSVIIVKDGPIGVYVITTSKSSLIGAYPTENVFSIGSGDVFTAVFFYYWAIIKLSPEKAADYASRATSLYVSKGINSITEEAVQNDHFPIQQFAVTYQTKPTVYLAGPFFNEGEIILNDLIFKQLKEFEIEVFSPFHDVGFGKDIASKDLEGLKDSDLLFANLNGKDTGTIFEIGYARALSIPVIIYVQENLGHHSTMIEGSECEIYNDLTSALYNVYWKSAGQN